MTTPTDSPLPEAALSGGCHCGNVRATLHTRRRPEALSLRACGCGFCRRHGARTLTDADGRLDLAVADGAALLRYRFGLRTADYLLCGRCGVYVAALVEVGRRSVATLNGNVLPALQGLPATPVDYDGEDAAGRLARRLARWTPTRLRIGS